MKLEKDRDVQAVNKNHADLINERPSSSFDVPEQLACSLIALTATLVDWLAMLHDNYLRCVFAVMTYRKNTVTGVEAGRSLLLGRDIPNAQSRGYECD